jgi:hypothetical protein
MSRKASVLILIIAVLLPLGLVRSALAHGGEDHGEEKGAPVASNGEMNTRLSATGDYEILVKYPNPKIGEETPLRVFITDLKTNAPLTGMNISMVLSQKSSIEADASPTQMQGLYEARVVFPDRGEYSLLVKLSGSGLNEELKISGIVVPERESAASSNSGRVILLSSIILILLSLALYIFWLRPRRSQSGMEAQGHVA